MIHDLYIYFLADRKRSIKALERFYMRGTPSREFVQQYAIVGKGLYVEFMRMYLDDIRRMTSTYSRSRDG